MYFKLSDKKFFYFFLVFILFIFHAINNYLILSHDNIPLLFDERELFYGSIEFYNILHDIFLKSDFSTAWKLLKNWSSPFPPLIQLTTAFSYFIFGISDDVAILSTLPYLFILFFSVYKIGQKLFSNSAGLLAAYLVSLFPMTGGMSRVYYLENSTTALISLALLSLLNTCYFRNRKYSFLFGIAFALALLAKWTSIIFIAGPFIYYLFITMFSKDIIKEDRKKIFINLSISLLICSILILPVYILLIKPFLSMYINIFSTIKISKMFCFSVNHFFRYFSYLYNYQLLPFFTILFCCSALFFLFKKKAGRGFLLLWFLFPSFFFTILIFCGYYDTPRFTMPFSPAIALIISTSSLSLVNKKVKIMQVINFFLITLIVIFGFVQYFRLSYDTAFKSLLLFEERFHHASGRYRPRMEDWKTKELIAIILNKSLYKGNEKAIILPLYNCDLINSPLIQELNNKYRNKNIGYDDFLDLVLGGHIGIKEDKFYEDKIKKADIVIIKEGMSIISIVERYAETPQALKILETYKIVKRLFEKNKNLFSLINSFDLPDNSKLLVYGKIQ
jgi:hypothetical protein